MTGLNPPFSFVWDSSILTKIDCRTNEKGRFLSLTLSTLKLPQKELLIKTHSALFSQSLTMFTGWQFQQQTKKKREEKWRSLLNHITDMYVHKENKIFQRCTHGELDRAWIKADYTVLHTF